VPASGARCSRPEGPRPPAPVWVEGWAGGGLAPLFSACLFSTPTRMSVLLLVCLFQASVMWRFIHFQLRRWREYWNEQSSRKRAAAGAKQQAKPLKRDSGECRDRCTVGRRRGRHQSCGSASHQRAAARAGDAAVVPPAPCRAQGVPSRVVPWWGFSPCLWASPRWVKLLACARDKISSLHPQVTMKTEW